MENKTIKEHTVMGRPPALEHEGVLLSIFHIINFPEMTPIDNFCISRSLLYKYLFRINKGGLIPCLAQKTFSQNKEISRG